MLLWKRLIDKLVLECEDEILNTTKSSLGDEKVACTKLLLAACVSCLFLYCKILTKTEALITSITPALTLIWVEGMGGGR